MSEKLLEADFLTTNLRALFPKAQETEVPSGTPDDDEVAPTGEETTAGTPEVTPEGTPEETAPTGLEALPGKGEWDKWKELLDKRISDNNKLSATEKKTEYEVESKFFREFFVENWDRSIGAKLLLLGDPLRKAIKVLGFDPTKNPILGFVKQKRVIDGLIYTGKLNVETFKAVYNAVANKLVAHSELINEKADNNEYNIIYCADLYSKPVKEMIEYLKLQSQILTVSSTEYTAEKQLENKRAFLDVGEKIAEQEETKRAKEINTKLGHGDFHGVANAKLNTLSLAREVCDRVSDPKTNLDGNGQDALVAKLATPADKYAALLALSLTTNNAAAQEALENPIFAGLSSDVKLKAVMTLSAKGIMPKGQLNKTDADSLVAKIIASMQKEN